MKLYYKLSYLILVLFILFDYGVFSPYAKGFGFLSNASDDTYQLAVSHRLLDKPADDNIRVVAIESKDLAVDDDNICESLTWPIISRSWFVSVLENLLAHKPKAIVVDFLFLSPSSECAEYDKQLIQIIKDNPNIFIATSKSTGETNLSLTPKVIPGAKQHSTISGKFGDSMNYPFFYKLFTESQEQRLGSANAMVDDLIVTQATLWSHTKRWEVPTLPLLVESYVNKHPLNTVENNEPYINWRSTDHLADNFTDVWLDDYSPEDGVKGKYTDKIVIIGTNMPARSVDVHAIPGDKKIPGIFVLSTIIDNIINDNFIGTHPKWVSILLTILFVTALFLSFDSQILTPHLGINLSWYEIIMDKIHNAFHSDLAGADFFLILEFSAVFLSYLSLEFLDYYVDFSGPALAGIAAFSVFSLVQGLTRKSQLSDGGIMKEYFQNPEFTKLHVMSIKGIDTKTDCSDIVEESVASIYQTGVAKLDLFKDDDIFGVTFDEQHYWWVSKDTSNQMDELIEQDLESKLQSFQFKDSEIVVVLADLDISNESAQLDQNGSLNYLILDLLSKVNQQYYS